MTHPTWRDRSLYVWLPVKGWPSYTPRNQAPFLSLSTTRRRYSNTPPCRGQVRISVECVSIYSYLTGNIYYKAMIKSKWSMLFRKNNIFYSQNRMKQRSAICYHLLSNLRSYIFSPLKQLQITCKRIQCFSSETWQIYLHSSLDSCWKFIHVIDRERNGKSSDDKGT